MWPSIGALLHYTWTSPQCEFTIFFRFPTVCPGWKHPSQDDCPVYGTFGFRITWSFKTEALLYKPWYTLTYFSTPCHTLTHIVVDLPPIQRPLLKMTGSFLVTDSIWWHTADIFVIVSINHIMIKPFIISSTQWKPLIWWATVSGTKYSNRTRDCSINPSSLYQSGAHSGDIGDNFSKS